MKSGYVAIKYLWGWKKRLSLRLNTRFLSFATTKAWKSVWDYKSTVSLSHSQRTLLHFYTGKYNGRTASETSLLRVIPLFSIGIFSPTGGTSTWTFVALEKICFISGSLDRARASTILPASSSVMATPWISNVNYTPSPATVSPASCDPPGSLIILGSINLYSDFVP